MTHRPRWGAAPDAADAGWRHQAGGVRSPRPWPVGWSRHGDDERVAILEYVVYRRKYSAGHQQ